MMMMMIMMKEVDENENTPELPVGGFFPAKRLSLSAGCAALQGSVSLSLSLSLSLFHRPDWPGSPLVSFSPTGAGMARKIALSSQTTSH